METDSTVRERILTAAFATFAERGFAQATTREIAARARVSKRELYAQVGDKHEMLVACIRVRATSMQAPADIPVPRNRAAFATVLEGVGVRLLRVVSDPGTIAMFRLAIAEAERAPEIARTLHSIGRDASRAVLTKVFTQGRSSEFVRGDPAEMAERFAALLWSDLRLGLLLGVARPPRPREAQRRARAAAAAVLQLYSM